MEEAVEAIELAVLPGLGEPWDEVATAMPAAAAQAYGL